MAVEHVIKVRDLRLRYGAPEVFGAHCSCGWVGEERRGRAAERNAHCDGRHHVDGEHVKPRPHPRA